MYYIEDENFARHLQSELLAYENFRLQKETKEKENRSPIDSELEYIDPTPSIHDLFVKFDKKFFWGSLGMVEVVWSNKMTLCAGMCYFQPRRGLCKISLSAPLLSLRPRKDLVETLLHEMIHAYLFVTNNNKDREAHGPEFHKHMDRINKEAGTKISVYHTFSDEVLYYQKYIWRCNGPCQNKKPYFGFVKRTMNRPPGPYDTWWKQHQAECGGTFISIMVPEKKVQDNKKTKEMPKTDGKIKDIRDFFNKSTPATTIKSQENKKTSNIVTLSDLKNKNPVGGMKTNAGTGTVTITNSKGKNSKSSNSKSSNPKSLNSKSSNSRKGVVKNKTRTPSIKEIFSVKAPSTGSTTTSQPTEVKDSCKKDSEDVNAKETVRNIWANKFSNSEPSDKEVTSKPSPKKIKLECPICAEGFPEEEIFNHTEACLESQKNPKTEEKEFPCESSACEKTDEMKQCPVCSKNFLQQEMDNHLESCLKCSFVNEGDGDSNEEIICDSVPCPCCYKWFKEIEMNIHINDCLTLNTLKEEMVGS